MRDGQVVLYVDEIPARPGRCLSINAKCHFHERNRQAQELRAAVRLAAVSTLNAIGSNPVPPKGDLGIEWTIWLGKGERRSDVDNAISRVKPAMDGLFDAIGTNDRRVTQVSVKQVRDPDGRGWLQVSLIALEGAS